MYIFNNTTDFGSAFATVQKFGRTPDIDSGDTNEDIWDGTGAYAGWLSANTAMTISSSSANDTEVGTGARTIKVFGLVENADGDWVETSESKNLDGQTAVNLTNSYIRVYRAYLTGTGSGDVNAGTIYVGSGTVTSGVPANVYAQIQPGIGQTLMAIYSTADLNSDGHRFGTFQLLQWYASIGAAQSAFASVALQANVGGNGWRTLRTGEVAEGGNVFQPWLFGTTVTAKTDIRLRVLSNDKNNSVVSGGFDLRMK